MNNFFAILIALASLQSSVSGGVTSGLDNSVSKVVESKRDLTACTVTKLTDLPSCLKSNNIVIKDLNVPAKKTLNLTNLKPGTHIVFQGTTKFGAASWEGPLVNIKGSNIQISGNGVLDGQGPLVWNGKGTNGQTLPQFFEVSLSSSSITGIKVKNSPAKVFHVHGSNHLTISGVTIDNKEGTLLGHNTDGIVVGSSQHVTLSHCNIFNQDDCVAVISGSDITVSDFYCEGGHGLSIGSIGFKADNDVRNVRFERSTIVNSQNGARIKTNYGATGSVTNATWTDIALVNITKYGIVIQQNYLNNGPREKATNGVKITDVTMHNITGTLKKNALPVYVFCGSDSCRDFHFDQINLSGGSKSSCNIPLPVCVYSSAW